MHNIQSPRTDDAGIENVIKAAGADKAPRVTLADLQANIVSEHYFTAEQGAFGARVDGIVRKGGAVTLADVPATEGEALELLTFCVLVLRNGFTVTGESACASPENFNAEIGRGIARQNAVAKIWPLMGYELKSRLAAAKAEPEPDFLAGVKACAIDDPTCEACQ